jgi:hypothetical protein
MDILACCTIVVLLLLVIHWIPWRLILKRPLPRMIENWLNMLGIMAPVTVTISLSKGDKAEPMVILWAATLSGGLAIMVAYWVDDWAEKRARAVEAEAREADQKQLLDQLVEDRR